MSPLTEKLSLSNPYTREACPTLSRFSLGEKGHLKAQGHKSGKREQLLLYFLYCPNLSYLTFEEKMVAKPSKEFLKETRKDIREIFLNHKGKPMGILIKSLNPVIGGKANYMNKVVSSTEFSKLDNYLFLRQVR